MRAGELRDLVTLQAEARTADGQGGSTIGPTAYVTDEPCDVDQLSQREQVQAAQLTTTATHRIRVRGRTDVRPQHRALVTYVDTGLTEAFQVEAVARVDDGRETHLYVVAVQG